MTKKIYFAGGLFDHKELAGNMLLAKKIEQLSAGRYQVLLPQDFESAQTDATSVRNNDYKLLMACDLIVANFDGVELDSGTVAEFCCAKMLDLPAVLFRTDFRNGVERPGAVVPWNLMISAYPRTVNLIINGMDELVRHDRDLEKYHSSIAERIIAAMDEVVAMQSLLPKEDLLAHYKRTLQLLGGGMSGLFTDEELQTLIAEKVQNGIY
ncbi:MAG: nucleoside 2-deoxyribosyltransferase [Lentisphaeria bacterium]|nr:nucleoside 2-deoxyribosyltransferase [Lentisphaeria bacterium]